jgi:hypothetical protein
MVYHILCSTFYILYHTYHTNITNVSWPFCAPPSPRESAVFSECQTATSRLFAPNKCLCVAIYLCVSTNPPVQIRTSYQRFSPGTEEPAGKTGPILAGPVLEIRTSYQCFSLAPFLLKKKAPFLLFLYVWLFIFFFLECASLPLELALVAYMTKCQRESRRGWGG